MLTLLLQDSDGARLAVHELAAHAQQPLLVRVGRQVRRREELFDEVLDVHFF